MERYPVAYIRRSYADASSTGDVSREVQEQAINDLAHRDGHNGDVVRFVDWGKSGSESKQASRTEYQKMLRAVEAGEVSTVYAYALDRLNRSPYGRGGPAAPARPLPRGADASGPLLTQFVD